jgi:MFS family permease
VLNTARRFAYPFAPVLSRGPGRIPVVDHVADRHQPGDVALLGALIGPLSDRLGYRKMMIAGMAMLAAGMLAAALFPHLCRRTGGPVSGRIGQKHFRSRRPGLGRQPGSLPPAGPGDHLLETSWSASTLIGIPLVAVLMDRYGWQSPFLVMGILGCIGAIALFFIIPKEPEASRSL